MGRTLSKLDRGHRWVLLLVVVDGASLPVEAPSEDTRLGPITPRLTGLPLNCSTPTATYCHGRLLTDAIMSTCLVSNKLVQLPIYSLYWFDVPCIVLALPFFFRLCRNSNPG